MSASAAAGPRRTSPSVVRTKRKKLIKASSCTSLPALPEQPTTRRPATTAAKKRCSRKKSLAALRPGAVEADWENELARNILVLYGSVSSRGDFRGSDNDFAVDEDATRRVPHRAKRRTRLCAIWFLGSGSLCAEWSALGEPEVFAVKLGALEEAGQYLAYVDAVSASLNTYARQYSSREQLTLFNRLWRQLVVAATVFGIRCVDQQRYADALELLKQAEILASSPEHLERTEMAELKAFVDDSHAYYYYKRSKPNAALAFATRAMRIHNKLGQYAHVAKCHLHVAAILSRMRRHPEAVKCLGQVLYLVNTGKLDVGDSTHGAMPHKLCMIAVSYHNLAVEQIFLDHAAEAAVSAQNARRLARLCLSYSNRWLHNFESTHKCATLQLAAASSTHHRRG